MEKYHFDGIIRRTRKRRSANFIQKLTVENSLSCNDLIYPMFVIPGNNQRQNIQSMPNVTRVSIDNLLQEAQELVDLGIPALALFPATVEKKLADASEAYNPEGIIPQAIRALKKQFPQLGIITDLALDPYTTYGKNGIVDKSNNILNDETIAVLCKQALCHAEAGVDIIGLADLLDGQTLAVRTELDKHNYLNTKLAAYSAKYNSVFYGPFADAMKATSNAPGNQVNDIQLDPANADQAVQQAINDLKYGADVIIVKPGMPYLDVVYRIKSQLRCPTFAYQVSGEYSSLINSIQNNWLSNENTILESLICFKRAGADAILTYFAKQAARLIRKT